MPTHTRAEAVKLALTVGGGPAAGPLRATLALVTDPLARKVGLPTAPTAMWMVRHGYRFAPPTDVPAPSTDISPGSLITEVTFVDDATLSLAGNSGC